MQLDVQYTKELKRLIGRSRKDALNFGLCLGKQPEQTALILHKLKDPENLMRRAKKQDGVQSAKSTCGTAMTEGKVMSLTCLTDPAPGTAKSCRLFLNKVGMQMRVVILDADGNVLESDGEDDDRAQDAAAPPPSVKERDPATPQPETDPLAAKWHAAKTKLLPLISARLKTADSSTEKLKLVWSKTEALADDNDHAAALNLVPKLVGLLKTPPRKHAEETGLPELRTEFGARWQKIKAMTPVPADLKKIATLIASKIQAGDVATAKKYLAHLDMQLDALTEPAPASDLLKVSVNFNSKNYDFSFPPDTRLGTVLEALLKQLGVPHHPSLLLYYGGKPRPLSETLASVGVVNHATLFVHMRVMGGGKRHLSESEETDQDPGSDPKEQAAKKRKFNEPEPVAYVWNTTGLPEDATGFAKTSLMNIRLEGPDDDDEGDVDMDGSQMIESLAIAGRPKGKHKGKQGQHVTAFVAIREAVISACYGRSIDDAKKNVAFLFSGLLNFPAFKNDDAQTPAGLKARIAALADVGNWGGMSLQDAITYYVELRDALPGASLPSRGHADTKSGGEAKTVKKLAEYEAKSLNGQQLDATVLKPLCKIVDVKALARLQPDQIIEQVETCILTAAQAYPTMFKQSLGDGSDLAETLFKTLIAEVDGKLPEKRKQDQREEINALKSQKSALEFAFEEEKDIAGGEKRQKEIVALEIEIKVLETQMVANQKELNAFNELKVKKLELQTALEEKKDTPGHDKRKYELDALKKEIEERKTEMKKNQNWIEKIGKPNYKRYGDTLAGIKNAAKAVVDFPAEAAVGIQRPLPLPFSAGLEGEGDMLKIVFGGRPDSYKDNDKSGDHLTSMVVKECTISNLLLNEGQIPIGTQLRQSVQDLCAKFHPKTYHDLLGTGSEEYKNFFNQNRYNDFLGKASVPEVDSSFKALVLPDDLNKLSPYICRLFRMGIRHKDLKDYVESNVLDNDAQVSKSKLLKTAELALAVVDDRPTAVNYDAPARGHGEAQAVENLSRFNTNKELKEQARNFNQRMAEEDQKAKKAARQDTPDGHILQVFSGVRAAALKLGKDGINLTPMDKFLAVNSLILFDEKAADGFCNLFSKHDVDQPQEQSQEQQKKARDKRAEDRQKRVQEGERAVDMEILEEENVEKWQKQVLDEYEYFLKNGVANVATIERGETVLTPDRIAKIKKLAEVAFSTGGWAIGKE